MATGSVLYRVRNILCRGILKQTERERGSRRGRKRQRQREGGTGRRRERKKEGPHLSGHRHCHHAWMGCHWVRLDPEEEGFEVARLEEEARKGERERLEEEGTEGERGPRALEPSEP